MLPFVVTNLVSLGLAVITLSRARSGGSQGTGFAVLAVVIDLLVLLAWSLALLAFTR